MRFSMSDGELMALVAMGDEGAFQQLVHRIRPSVRSFLSRLGCNLAEVDDLAQETLIRLWVHRAGYSDGKPLRPYLLTIAKNVYVSYCRCAATRREMPGLPREADELDRLLLRAGRLAEGPEGLVLGRYEEFRLSRAVGKLPQTDRLVFVLRHHEGLKYREISEMLGIAEGTVKSRMFRAVRALRQALPDLDPNGTKEEI